MSKVYSYSTSSNLTCGLYWICYCITFSDRGCSTVYFYKLQEVYDGHYVPASIKVQVIGRGRKEMEGNRASLMDFTAADYHTATTHPPRNN